MTEEPQRPDRADDEADLPEPMSLPKWVPVAIGLVLVGMAALAIYTGVTYRATTLARKILPIPERPAAPSREIGAPGEPQAGASRVLHGEAGDAVPAPGAIVEDASRVAITGAGGAITGTMRLSASRGLVLDVKPPDAIAYMNGQAIGEVRQFRSAEDAWEFPDPGQFTLKISAPGHKELEYVINVDHNAPEELAVIRAEMEIE
jgi:hypothetical protein